VARWVTFLAQDAPDLTLVLCQPCLTAIVMAAKRDWSGDERPAELHP
jgi:hypothetical protein